MHGWHSRAQLAADGEPVCGRDPVIRYTVLLPLAPVLLGVDLVGAGRLAL